MGNKAKASTLFLLRVTLDSEFFPEPKILVQIIEPKFMDKAKTQVRHTLIPYSDVTGSYRDTSSLNAEFVGSVAVNEANFLAREVGAVEAPRIASLDEEDAVERLAEGFGKGDRGTALVGIVPT